MLASATRMLTTHTGSVPRPAALTELSARRAEGEAIDEVALDVAGKAATRHVVRQQIAASTRWPKVWRSRRAVIV
jgi:5-methyltetrahydropteroyltriglutamate--homocysteine methyltransferase